MVVPLSSEWVEVGDPCSLANLSIQEVIGRTVKTLVLGEEAFTAAAADAGVIMVVEGPKVSSAAEQSYGWTTVKKISGHC